MSLNRDVAWVALLAIFVLVGSGCMTIGPNYVAPEKAMPDAWHQALTSGLESGENTIETWWTIFQDPVLDELIVEVGVNNLDLQLTAERIREARTQLAIARGQYYPTVNASGTAQRTRLSEATTPTVPAYRDRTDNYYELGPDVYWEMDLWGRVARLVESAQAGEEASVEAYRDLLVILYAETALNYVQLRTVQRRLTLAKKNAKLQEETLQLTKDRFKAGIVPKLDVRQAELNLASTESLIPSLDIGQTQIINRICVLLGKMPGELYEKLSSAAPIPAPNQALAMGLPSDLLRQRPDLRQAERELAAQTARIGVAQAELYPIFSLGGTLSLQSYSSSDLFEGGSRAYGFGPNFRWNIFSGGRVRNAIKVEESRTEQALLNYEQRVLLAVEEVENAMVAYVLEQDRAAALKRSAIAAQDSVDLVNTLYRTGLTNFQNVLDMQRSLFQREDEMAASDGEVVLNLVQLYKALGGGWSMKDSLAEEAPATEESQG